MVQFDDDKLTRWILGLQLPLEEVTATIDKLRASLEEVNFFRGKRGEIYMIACIYVACKILRKARSMIEICEICCTNKSQLNSKANMIMEALDYKCPRFSEAEYVQEACIRLKLDSKVEEEAKRVLKTAPGTHLGGSNAAAAIYVAAERLGIAVDKEKVADTLMVSVKTMAKIERGFNLDRLDSL
ncbi:hypothetical protein ACOME3_001608 [Neoechinorhynchus agilis]